jgi:8-oxo-dGTP diphosphatase
VSIEAANRWFETDPDVPLDLSDRHGAAVVVIDALGRVLLQQRDDMTPPEGFGRWAIPGGGAEPGESARMAAIREIAEETAIQLDSVTYFGSIHVAPHDESRASGALVIHLFWSRSDHPEADIVVGEGIAFRFWTPAEVRTLPMNPNGRHWLARFLSSEVFATLDPMVAS